MNSLKSRAINCGPFVRDDPGFRLRVLFLGSFQNHFDLRFLHRFPQIPMHNRPAISIQNTAQVVERARQVDVGNIDVPVLVRLRRLLKPRPFARGLPFHRDNSPACFNTQEM
jgi:hypothetical protein